MDKDLKKPDVEKIPSTIKKTRTKISREDAKMASTRTLEVSRNASKMDDIDVRKIEHDDGDNCEDDAISKSNMAVIPHNANMANQNGGPEKDKMADREAQNRASPLDKAVSKAQNELKTDGNKILSESISETDIQVKIYNAIIN